jgi:L-threonylcarbamoyladenylate synthase
MVQIVSCLSDLSKVGSAVREGSLVVFPTDTVFGLGSNPLSKTGICRCFQIKGREGEKKMPILFSGKKHAEEFVSFSGLADLLARNFWPGQLTMILPAKSGLPIPEELVSQDGTLAVRVPDHECCIRLISACGNALIGTSANFSGFAPSTDLDDPTLLEFVQKADYFVNAPCGRAKVASTIINFSEENRINIVREGAVSRNDISVYLEKINRTDFSFSTVSN